jgi:ferrochelatase
LDQAIQEAGGRMSTVQIQDWHTHPAFLDAILEKVQDSLLRFCPQQPYILFTAHSLPARILAQGDPYEQLLNETAGLLADKLGLEAGKWQFCFQSAGQSQEPWLGPPIEVVIPDLVQSGVKNILVVPIGFVSDHIEILFDLDIVCRQLAEKAGARLERTESLNASPAFIHALTEICQNAMAELSIQ